MTLDQRLVVMTALAAVRTEATFDPVQVQHLLFLLDQRVPNEVDGPHFAFAPSSFGPFDYRACTVLFEMLQGNQLEIQEMEEESVYALTPKGFEMGSNALSVLAPSVATYLSQLAGWVRTNEFSLRLEILQASYPGFVLSRNRVDIEPSRVVSIRRGLVEDYANQSSTQSFMMALAQMIDVKGSLNDYDKILQILRDSQRVSEIWPDVGDDLREAMALNSCGPPELAPDYETSRSA